MKKEVQKNWNPDFNSKIIKKNYCARPSYSMKLPSLEVITWTYSGWPAITFWKKKYNSRTIHEIFRKIQVFKLLEVEKNAKQGGDKNN